MTKTDRHIQPEPDNCLFCMEHLEEAAMRILEPEVQRRMESHLARCRMCRAELAEIEQPLHLLAFSVEEVEPRAETKDSFMARFEAERDQPKVSPPLPFPTQAPEISKPEPVRRSPRFLPWSYSSMFVGVLVAFLAIGIWNFLPIDTSDGDLPDGQIEVMAMELTCTDCDEATGGHIGADPKEKDGLVVAWNLDPHRKHEVWCVNREGKHTKVGDLKVADSGSVMQAVSFPDAVGGYDLIYVVRDDGAEELSVVPDKNRYNLDSPGTPSTPAD